MMIIMPFPSHLFLMYYYLAHIVLMLSTCCADGKHQWCWVQISLQKVINCSQKCLHKYSLISIKKSKYNYCCPIKPLYTAISSLNPAEIGMIGSYFKFQAPLE